MRLSDALRINQRAISPGGRTRTLHLVCSSTPLHLETLLRAHAQQRFEGDSIQVATGLFGDLHGTLCRAVERPAEGAAVVLEWRDLDDRLSFRASAGWNSEVHADILEQLPEKLDRLERVLTDLAAKMPVALTGPTLPAPPIAHHPPPRSSTLELQLRRLVADLVCRLGAKPGIVVVDEQQFAAASPPAGRHDVKLDLFAGFPYTLPHADAIASLAVEALFPPSPKKGLITDLDETLWRGILGDIGSDKVSWSLEDHSQHHALYQQILGSLASSGVLIAVASKNDPVLVRQAFERRDLLLPPGQVFPIEASWGAKSEAVSRILAAWNIGADTVVFVDDSPMELAEVAEHVPGIECLRFPTDEPAAIVGLLHELRRRFGKTEVRDEDRLRLNSLRAMSAAQAAQQAETGPDFLARAQARITLTFRTAGDDARAFELLNKTNQFNLNGRRLTDGEWRDYFARPSAFLTTVHYEDRFGPLGRIAAVVGRVAGNVVHVDYWAMSCRAFSRHIEYQTIRQLFQHHGATVMELTFASTSRNGPLRDFLARFFPGPLSDGALRLSAESFDSQRPTLFHDVTLRNE